MLIKVGVVIVILLIGICVGLQQVAQKGIKRALLTICATIVFSIISSLTYDWIKPYLPLPENGNPTPSSSSSSVENGAVDDTAPSETTSPIAEHTPSGHNENDITGKTSVSGTIGYEGQINTYSFIAQIEGTYRFDVDLNAGVEVRVRICGENGNTINYGTNGLSIDLEAEKTYVLSIEYINGTCDYDISIGIPYEITNITGNTSVDGSITYQDQANRYRYTAPVSGTYRFDADVSAGGEVRLRISGENGNSLNYGTNGLTIDLDKGKTYLLSIEYMNGPCDFTIMIGVPIALTDINGSRSITGSITYQDQKDKYLYTAPVDGTYRLDTNLSSGGEVRLRISGENGNSINYGTNGLTIDLEAGETYIISAEYINGVCDYTINIGVPNEMSNITGKSSVSGSITYQDQKDKYYYTAPISGTYSFKTNLSAGGEVRVRISGENGKSLNYGTNGLTADLETNKTYIVSVEYTNGPCTYDLLIGY